MREDLKISIIIPVYSVENYLPTCIESVLHQSYLNTEIILVDDGSPDDSGKICDEYAALFSNIKVIHKGNGGLSDARNRGIDFATGDYIAFLDGDDFWDDKDALKELVERLEKTKVDVLNFSFKKYYEDTREEQTYFRNVQNMPLECKKKSEQLAYLSRNDLYLSSACTKLIRRDLFNNDLMFEKGVYSEDVEWSAKLIIAAKSLDFVCSDFYCYRQRKDSISHTINDKKCQDLCKHVINCIKMSTIASDEEKKALSKYAAYQYGTFFLVQANAKNVQISLIDELSEYSDILLYHGKNKKLTVLYWGTKILGYKALCRIIRFMYGLRKQYI